MPTLFLLLLVFLLLFYFEMKISWLAWNLQCRSEICLPLLLSVRILKACSTMYVIFSYKLKNYFLNLFNLILSYV